VQDAGEVLQHGAEYGAAGSGFRGVGPRAGHLIADLLIQPRLRIGFPAETF
jgi:hypothetical protein